jgi:hypothetical protein
MSHVSISQLEIKQYTYIGLWFLTILQKAIKEVKLVPIREARTKSKKRNT